MARNAGQDGIKPSEPQDERWMLQAIVLAHKAESLGEVPVGALVVWDGKVVGKGFNHTIGLNDPTAHAEILALREAGQLLGNYRLPDCTLYVTLEPCAMCVGAMVHSRIARLVFGAVDPKTGAAGGCFNLLGLPDHNHSVLLSGRCLEQACGDLLRTFFRSRR